MLAASEAAPIARTGPGHYLHAVADELDPDDALLVEYLARSFGASLIESGEWDPRGLKPHEMVDALAAKIREHVEQDLSFEVRIDHQDGILDQAREFVDRDQYDFAVVFYAIWVEHWLNWMLVWRAGTDGLSDDAIKQLMMLSIHAKLTVAWPLLLRTPLDSALASRIETLAGWRNHFVHYKWKGFDPEAAPDHADLAELKRRAKVADQLVENLEELKAEIVYGDTKIAQFLSMKDATGIAIREAATRPTKHRKRISRRKDAS